MKVMPNDYRRVLQHRAEIEARAAALSRTQSPGSNGDSNGDAAGGETLVNAGLKQGGSDVGTGNRG